LKNNYDRKILVFAQEAGSAALLIPVIERLSSYGYTAEIHALPPALHLFKARFDCVNEWTGFPDEKFDLLLAGYGNPRVPVNSNFFAEARRFGVNKSIALLDNWRGLDRFFDKNGNASTNMPSIIAVMDSETEDYLIRKGIPADKLVVTGHPGLEILSTHTITMKDRIAAREKLNLPIDKMIYFLASEIIHNHSYHEPCDLEGNKCFSLFNIKVDNVSLWRNIVSKYDKDDTLFILKAHPNEKHKITDELRIIEWEDFDEIDIINAVDVVFGLASMFVLISVAAGIETYNVQPFLSAWMPQNSFMSTDLWTHLTLNGYLGELGNIKAARQDHTGALNRVLNAIEENLRI